MKKIWKGSPNYDNNRKDIKTIVCHWFGMGTLSNADAQFQKPGGTSAHYAISGNIIHQYVAERHVAYHAGNYLVNQSSIGIEHDANPKKNLSEESYKTSGKLVAEIAKKYNIPLDRKHIIKHSEVKATQCCGTIDVDKIISIARGEDMAETIKVEKKDWERARKSMDILEAVHGALNLSGEHIDGKDRYLEEIERLQTKEVDFNNHKCPEHPKSPVIEPIEKVRTGSKEYIRDSEGKVIEEITYAPMVNEKNNG